MNVRRFTLTQRVFHWLMALSFMVQSATGLARMHASTPWGERLASVFGGQEGNLLAHKAGGVVMVCLLAAHVLHVLFSSRPGAWFGPDSMMPRWRDFGDFLRHTGWMLGISKHPRLERWAYWEKFDYWAVFWGVAIIGGSGLLLVNPVLSARYVPGWWLNIALALHRDEAFLAMGYIFLVHFTVAHLRRSQFPMDMAIVDGCMSLEEVSRDRGDWKLRLDASGGGPGCPGGLSPGARGLALAGGWAVILCGWLLAAWTLAAIVGAGLA
uniref:Cytochrome b/b6 domain-containing protein n=1 Tax=Fundidesulfovibrio putealis TaxID=270496 RepID=A0A7C4EN73_9BACT